MTVTEFVSFKLKQKLSEEQLRQNEPWQNCLDVLHRQPGCKDLKWGSLIEDAETVVLLVEWNELADHERFMKSPIYEPFKMDLLSLFDIKQMNHFDLDPPVSRVLSADRPVLELFMPNLNESTSLAEHDKLFSPISDAWKQEGRPFTVSSAVDKDASQKVLFVIPWTSVDEHNKAKEGSVFNETIGKVRPTWAKVDIYAHIKPQQS